jgi:(R)-2-hydroxyglutarate---pyruvate transhydrogenase
VEITHFRKLLNDSPDSPSVLTGDDTIAYNSDWMNKYRGQGCVVLRPKNVSEVSEIMKYCNENVIPVVPQGGNTGLVGAFFPKIVLM